ncbi:MAG: DUF1848 domain-containing protein [Chloroflexi bacterium]|jgi:hypothetical protein|nr:DUF1848 domain-containing protein [Chloroflexota bacterium]
MGLVYRLADYEAYARRVGAATVIDLTRRTDPARASIVWERLRDVRDAYGAPWIVQVWTKNPAGVLALGQDLLRELMDAGTTVAAQVTVTGLAGTPWEPLVPADGLRALPRLAWLLGGAAHITWRYDPILPSVHSPERFTTLARQAAEAGISRGVINFVAAPGHYKRVDRRLQALLPGWAEGMPGYDAGWKEAVARELVEIAAEQGIALGCCAESAGLAGRVPGLRVAACGDYEWFAALSGQRPPRAPFRGSRPGCGCVPYFDVGMYGNWSRCHRCAYCYAG